MLTSGGIALTRSVIETASYPGSNSYGSLYLENLEPLSFSDQLIYTSDQSGNSDSFTLMYRVNPDEMQASGNFSGQIVYTVRPIGSSSEDQRILNVFLEDAGELQVATSASSGSNLIELKSGRLEDQEGYFKISLQGNVGGDVRIYQEILDYPRNELNKEINRQVVQFMTNAENQTGLNYQTPTDLEREKVLLYTSQHNEDSLDVYFKINEEALVDQKAGRYSTQIRYLIEGDDINQVIDANLIIEITPILKLVIDAPAGGLSFKRLLPDTPPQVQEIYLTVQTNLDTPYMINQTINVPLTNEDGIALEDEYFTIKQEFLEGKTGDLQFQNFDAVPIGDTPIFYSDATGSPAKIKVIYRIKPYRNMQAGSYQTMILFSLGEI